MRIIIPIVLLCLVSNCRREDKIPAGIFSREKMEAVMWDMMQADQFLTDFVFNRDTSLDRLEGYTSYYQQILDVHKISKEEFKRSFIYYRDRPALMKEVLDSLSSRTVVDQAAPIAPVELNDSLIEKKKRFRPKAIQ